LGYCCGPPTCSRVNRRFASAAFTYLFRDTLVKLVEAPVLEYKALIAAA
jgi:hypothetical protein